MLIPLSCLRIAGRECGSKSAIACKHTSSLLILGEAVFLVWSVNYHSLGNRMAPLLDLAEALGQRGQHWEMQEEGTLWVFDAD